MTLRTRIALALLVITVVLVAPAIYSSTMLGEVRDIARELRARDAAGALALGRLQAEFREVARLHLNYSPLALTGAAETELAQMRSAIASHSAAVNAQLDNLAAVGYSGAAEPAREEWLQLEQMMSQERQLIDVGALDQAETFRNQTAVPAMDAFEATMRQIGTSIDAAGEQHARTAEGIADRARTTTLLALAVALALAILIAALLTRSLLRPITELRWGMNEVASGSFEPTVAIPYDRKDEIGDLARSFEWMTRELAEYDRLRSEFVSIASHELKTPLSVIKGYVALLLEGIYGDVAPEQRKVLGSVSDQSDRLGRLIQQLLDISRFEAGGGRLELRSIDIRAFLRELVTSFEALAIQNQIEFALDVRDSLPESIVGDPDRLNEVLGNLLSNAFKFTPRNGRIRLRAAEVADGVRIQVEDTGVGIPGDQIPRIFEKFYQVENAAQPRSIGSGLGLAISREIVEAHGGTITAASEEGRGTTFTVLLPRDPKSSERSPVVTASR
jgi:signal transduction histidine kinase